MIPEKRNTMKQEYIPEWRYLRHEPTDGAGDDGIIHRVIMPAVEGDRWNRHLLIGRQPCDEKRAKLIVACVNACRGLNPDDMPGLIKAADQMADTADLLKEDGQHHDSECPMCKAVHDYRTARAHIGGAE